MVQLRAMLTMADQQKSRIWSIEWCHFQWPWTTPTPSFKFMPFLTLNISEMVQYTIIQT